VPEQATLRTPGRERSVGSALERGVEAQLLRAAQRDSFAARGGVDGMLDRGAGRANPLGHDLVEGMLHQLAPPVSPLVQLTVAK
jgi:hypothetical protein